MAPYPLQGCSSAALCGPIDSLLNYCYSTQKSEVFIIVLLEPSNEKMTFLYVIITAVYAESRVEHPCKVFAG